MKRVALLGSTGSIGLQALDVCQRLSYRLVSLAALRNIDTLEAQARRFRPDIAAVYDPEAARTLKIRLADTSVTVLGGSEGICEAAGIDCDITLNAIVGVSGLRPAMAALTAGHTLALANKETLVAAGPLVMAEAVRRGVRVIPVDSEHSAIFQCLQNAGHGEIASLTLTASGGPFFGWTRDKLRSITPEAALRHPNWSMGPKITVDSATLMNKGLELIEAMHLFALPPERIEIVVHRQSIIHSMVNFVDGATLAQMGRPDMRVAIAYALSWPSRKPLPVEPVDWGRQTPLTFDVPDSDAFGCLALARQAASRGMAACIALNAANEVAVDAFLKGRLSFLAIEETVASALARAGADPLSIEDCLTLDAETRHFLCAE